VAGKRDDRAPLGEVNDLPRPLSQFKADGPRAVMFCSTTDPYQVIHHPDPVRRRELAAHARFLVRRSLELIRDHSTLNVRILTRSPLAREDFELFRSFGSRLLFGMSLPTLHHNLARFYEPKAPAPSQRLVTLRAAKAAGLHVYVARATATASMSTPAAAIAASTVTRRDTSQHTPAASASFPVCWPKISPTWNVSTCRLLRSTFPSAPIPSSRWSRGLATLNGPWKVCWRIAGASAR
jgi:hypothetical protein